MTHWSATEWFTYRGNVFPNDKRTGFLPYLDLPRQTKLPMELALCLAADDELRLRPDEAEEFERLTARDWRVVHAHAVSATPWEYQHYLQGSRGEFSCAKPATVRLQTAWISDRTICYLASGRPAIVEHTGPSRFLPEACGLFRFRNLQQAVWALEEVASEYDWHCQAARLLAEEYFAASKVVPRVLDRALDKRGSRYFPAPKQTRAATKFESVKSSA
ncbi:MAG: hypothetical protein H0V54_07745 [Chthoniobacterales bacterium]|nr:hypothetical protein [Chthoniobacterales bacterium]